MVNLKSRNIMKNIFFIILMMSVSFHADAQKWVKLDKHSDVKSTDVCLIVEVNSGYALSSNTNTSGRPKAVKVNLVGDVIQDDQSITDDLKWNFIKGSTGYFIRRSSNTSYKLVDNNGLIVSSNSSYKTNWILDASQAQYYGFKLSTASEYLCYNSTSNVFWNIYSTAKSQNVHIFKYVSAPVVQAPVLSVSGGIYVAPFTLELTTEEGAEIYYTLDGSIPDESSSKYSGGINIQSTTVINAVAIKNGEKSDVVTAEYHFAETLNTINEFYQADDLGYVKLKLDKAQVTAINGDEVFIQDATGGMMLYQKDLSLNVGDGLEGSILGRKIMVNGIPVIDAECYKDLEKTESASLDPIAVSMADLLADTSGQYAFRLVKLINVGFENGFLVHNDSELKVLFTDYFNVLSDDEIYPPLMDVTGLWMTGDNKGLSVRNYDDIKNVSGLEQPVFNWSVSKITVDLSETDIRLPELNNNSDGKVTYNSSNPSVASIDANGTITLNDEGITTISAVVSASLNFLSAKAEYVLTVTNNEGVQKPKAYVSEDKGLYYAMGNTQKTGSNRLDAYQVHILNGTVVNTLDDKTILNWYVDKENGTIQNSEGFYVAYSKETYLVLQSSKYSWSYNETDGYWYDKDTKRIIDLSGSKTYFRCYDANSSTSCFMPVVDGYGREVTEGRFGTICLPYRVEAGNFKGATFHRIFGKRVNNENMPTELVLSEPVEELEAGEPYVFLPTSNQIILAYANESTGQAGENNGLVGTFDGINSDGSNTNALQGMYLFSNNQLKKSGIGGKLGQNRAYVDMDKVPVLDATTEVNGLFFRLNNGNVTAINEPMREENRKYDVYSLSGNLVRRGVIESDALEGLPSGIYLLNGKKYLVK